MSESELKRMMEAENHDHFMAKLVELSPERYSLEEKK